MFSTMRIKILVLTAAAGIVLALEGPMGVIRAGGQVRTMPMTMPATRLSIVQPATQAAEMPATEVAATEPAGTQPATGPATTRATRDFEPPIERIGRAD